MKLIPHFTFDGCAEEALDFYAKVFKGEVICTIHFEDFQAEMPEVVNEENKHRLMYSTLAIGKDCLIAMCDNCPKEEAHKESNIFMDVSYADVKELKRVYEDLSAGGEVLMPLGKTPWSENFASVVDKFGIGWNLMEEDKQ